MEDRLRKAAYTSGGFHGYGEKHEEPARPQKHTPETKALAILGLAASAPFKMIKEKYRELVKQHHPDRNGGDVQAEERFKTISQAFHVLKRAYEVDKVS
jgi:DnaJ-domain-containing protein 1